MKEHTYLHSAPKQPAEEHGNSHPALDQLADLVKNPKDFQASVVEHIHECEQCRRDYVKMEHNLIYLQANNALLKQEAGGQHLSDGIIKKYLEQSLPASEAEVCKRHMRDCSACMLAVLTARAQYEQLHAPAQGDAAWSLAAPLSALMRWLKPQGVATYVYTLAALFAGMLVASFYLQPPRVVSFQVFSSNAGSFGFQDNSEGRTNRDAVKLLFTGGGFTMVWEPMGNVYQLNIFSENGSRLADIRTKKTEHVFRDLELKPGLYKWVMTVDNELQLQSRFHVRERGWW